MAVDNPTTRDVALGHGSVDLSAKRKPETRVETAGRVLEETKSHG